MFGIEAEATDIYGGKLNAEGYKSVAKQLADKFHFEKVAITLRESHSAFDNGWSAMLYDVEFAVAASALKHSIEGDYNMMTVSEVEKLAGGDGSGRIQR